MSPRLPSLRVVPPAECRPHADLGVLLLLLVTHLVPLAALLAGHHTGVSAQGYATFVVLLASRELVRELRRSGPARPQEAG